MAAPAVSALRSRTSPQGALRRLARPSDRQGLLQLARHGGALLLSGTLVALARGGWWLLLLVPLHGLLLIFLFAPLHEAIHLTAFRSRRLNRAVALICGFLLLLPPAWFRAFHLAHHRYTQDPERDPELARPKPETRRQWLLHVSGLPTWWQGLRLLLRHALGTVEEPFVAPRERPRIIREARVVLLLYGAVACLSLAAESDLALWLWIVPALVGQPALRLFLLAEHSGRPHLPDMLQNSRTTRTSALVRALAWNMPYHAEHHAFPALPFHALPQAHGLLAHRIAEIAPGYLAVNRAIFRGLRGKPAS